MESLLKRARDFMLSRDKTEQKPDAPEDSNFVEKPSNENVDPEAALPPFVTTVVVPMEEDSTPATERRSTRCQSHQHFTSSFFVRKCITQLFSM
jgi:hypothetical protein